MFLVNQTESELPRVTQASRERLAEADAAWKALKTRADELADKELPGPNQWPWQLGVGAIWKD